MSDEPDEVHLNPSQAKAVEAIAKVFYDGAVQSARKKVANFNLPLDKIRETLDEARESPDDRTAAIILFALLDDLMIHLLKRNMNQNIKGGVNKLFENYGMLSTASSRITLAYALAWISESTQNSLNFLRKIRNAFAHNISIKTLKSDVVSGWLNSMHHAESDFVEVAKVAVGDDPKHIMRPFSEYTLRDKLVLRGAWLARRIVFELTTFPIASAHQVSPMDVMPNWDTLPEAMKGLHRCIAIAIIPILRKEVDVT